MALRPPSTPGAARDLRSLLPHGSANASRVSKHMATAPAAAAHTTLLQGNANSHRQRQQRGLAQQRLASAGVLCGSCRVRAQLVGKARGRTGLVLRPLACLRASGRVNGARAAASAGAGAGAGAGTGAGAGVSLPAESIGAGACAGAIGRQVNASAGVKAASLAPSVDSTSVSAFAQERQEEVEDAGGRTDDEGDGPLGSFLDYESDGYYRGRLARTAEGKSQVLAAVDLGTNSFHMVVVKADDRGNFQIQDVEKEEVRLGSGSAGFSVITPDAEERALAAIKRFKKIADTRGASMRIVATSAVREARNRRAFVRRMNEAAGVEVEVVSGREEARLIYLGILQAMPVYHRTVLTVDIGGGSTEFVIGKKGKPLLATSLKLGHIRLTERFASDPQKQKPQLEEMRRYIRVMLADSGVIEAVKSLEGEIEMAIGSSGTIETIEQMINMSGEGVPKDGGGNGTGGGSSKAQQAAAQGGSSSSASNGAAKAGAGFEAGAYRPGGGSSPSPQLQHEPNTCPVWGFQEREFTREQLSSIVRKICKAKSAESRAKIPGLPERRADVIVGGAILLEEIFMALGVTSMKVSPYALREGVIADTLEQTCKDYCLTTDLRRSSVLKLAVKFNTERRLDSALHSAELAKQILAGLRTCKLGGEYCLTGAILSLNLDTDVEILEASTILHYVGMFISHKGYHKHSYYLIKNSEQLLGYTPIEIEMIALLVLFHRKKVPSNKDETLAKLPEQVRQKIRVLTAILRVAVALDRCDTGAVERVQVLQDVESCVLAITPGTDPKTGAARDVSLEMWAAMTELEYFQKVFKKTSSIVLIDDLDAFDMTDSSRSLSS